MNGLSGLPAQCPVVVAVKLGPEIAPILYHSMEVLIAPQ